jgi:N-acetylmuramoyl-L-alanine amidase
VKIWPGIFAAALLAGCQSAPQSTTIDRGDYQLETLHQAQGADQRIRFLVMHYTAEDFHSSLKTLTDEHVSAHYLLPAHPPLVQGKPVAFQLVPEAPARMACRGKHLARQNQPERYLDRD